MDNYHLEDMQIREIGVDLPRGYYSQLPKLVAGPFAGLPRVFGAAWSLIAHTDSLFEPETLRRYLLAYQEVQPLTIGELWAVPITLRIVLIENLRRLAELIAQNSAARHAADRLADRMIAGGGAADANVSAEDAATVLDSVGPAPLNHAFVLQLAHRWRGSDPSADPVLPWLERRLVAQGTTTDAVVHDQLQEQSAFSATVRNIITSLRLIAGIDWTAAFEDTCLVDRVLASRGCFRQMDFTTRNLYRTAIEVLARGCGHSEVAIAQAAVALAGASVQPAAAGDPRAEEPGYFLLGLGQRTLQARIGFRPALPALLGRWFRGLGIAGYGACVVALAGVFTALPLLLCAGLATAWPVPLGALGFVFASDTAVACLNRWVMWAFGATPLPALELADGVPPESRTLVAVPMLLTSLAAIAAQVARLEVHYLACRDGALHFALLSDWTDHTSEHAEGDAALLDAAEAGIAALNLRHGGTPGGVRFLLLHRSRQWNAGEASCTS
jgi:cyclic beta-1,2-glucan synthetase